MGKAAKASLIPVTPDAGRPAITLSKAVTLLVPPKTDSGGPQLHLVILNSSDGVYIRDLSGRAKLHVNGQPVTAAALRNKDRVGLGAIEYELTAPDTAASQPGTDDTAVAELWTEGDADLTRLTEPVTIIGRGDSADVQLDGGDAPEAQAMIIQMEGRHWIWNLTPGEGTRVNGKPVQSAPLSGECALELAGRKMQFRVLPTEERRKIDPVATPSAAQEAVPLARSGRSPPATESPAKGDRTTAVRHSTSSGQMPGLPRTQSQQRAPPQTIPFPARATAPINPPPTNPPPFAGDAHDSPPTPAPARTPAESASGVAEQPATGEGVESFKNWGPLAFAMVSVHQHDLPPVEGAPTAAGELDPQNLPPQPSSRGGRVWLVLLVFTILAAAAGGFWYLYGRHHIHIFNQ